MPHPQLKDQELLFKGFEEFQIHLLDWFCVIT